MAVLRGYHAPKQQDKTSFINCITQKNHSKKFKNIFLKKVLNEKFTQITQKYLSSKTPS